MKVLRLRLDIDAQRQQPITDGYRASMWFGDEVDGVPSVHDAVVVFEDTEIAKPGETHIARAWVVFSDLLPNDAIVGRTLRFLEGHRRAETATILEVLVDPEPFPGRDYAAAKTRVLDQLLGGWVFEQNLRPYLETIAALAGGQLDDDDWIGIESGLFNADTVTGQIARRIDCPLTSRVAVTLEHELGTSVISFELAAEPGLAARADAVAYVMQTYALRKRGGRS